MPSLREILRRFPKHRLLVIGDLVADHYVYGQSERISREAPVLIVRHERDEVKLGGAANAAANARSLGGRVTALGVLGADDMGKALRRAFRAQDIELIAFGARGSPTETKTRILAGGVNTTRQQMLRVDRGPRGGLPASAARALCRELRARAAEVDAVVVSDYGGGVIGPEVRATLRELAAEGRIVCADSRYALSSLTGLTVLKPNEPELAALTGRAIDGEDQLKEAAERARKTLSCERLLVTRGRSGMALFGPDGELHALPVHGAAEAVDVTGAGDTVLATFTLALAARASAVDAARLANIAAGLVVQKPGTATVSAQEMAQELGP